MAIADSFLTRTVDGQASALAALFMAVELMCRPYCALGRHRL